MTVTGPRLLACGALALALSAAAPAPAPAPKGGGGSVSALRSHDTNAPVDFTADRIELQDRADRVVLTGNVHIVQADMTMNAPRVTVAYTRAGTTDVQRMDASGGVVVQNPTQTARGSIGIYDLQKHLITLLGAVSLTQAANVVHGNRLVIDLTTGRATVDGSAVSGSAPGTTSTGGGRVSGRFTVPQRDKTAAPASAPAKPKG